MGTGLFTRGKIAIAKMDEQTCLPIGRVGEADRAISSHVGMADYRTCM